MQQQFTHFEQGLEDRIETSLAPTKEKLSQLDRRMSEPKTQAENPRRLTLVGGKIEMPAGGMTEPMVRMQQPIPEENKLAKVSPKSYTFLKEQYRVWVSANQDGSKNYVDFISDPVLKQLIDIGKMHEWPGFELFTYEDAYNLKNHTIISLMALACRPRTSAKAFVILLTESVSVLKPVNPEWSVGVSGWDVQMFSGVSRVLNEIRDVYTFLTTDIPAEESARLPKMVWGPKNEPGMLQFFMKILDKAKKTEFSKTFIAKIGEPALKLCKSMEEFLTLMNTANTEIARQAREHVIQEADLLPKPDPSEILTEVFDKTMQRKLLAGRALVDHAGVGSGRARFNLLDQTPVKTDPMSVSSVRLTQEDPTTDDDDDAYLWAFMDSTRGTHAARPGARSGTPAGNYKDAPKERQLPCYEHFEHKTCPAGAACIYSHNPQSMEEHAQRAFKKLLKSPYCGAQWMQTALNAQRSAPSAPSAGGSHRMDGGPRVHQVTLEDDVHEEDEDTSDPQHEC